METKLMHPNEKIKLIDIEKEMRRSFLDYSMSVIVARALPDVRDGLKPVHRRILYSQFKEGLTHDKPYRKCAATAGAVIRDFHPHGDQSVYDALVRMAQDFSMRYPLIEGHGNFGSIDGDPAAHYRYTEARLARMSEEMLRDINKETVDFAPTYDDFTVEPTVLPSRFPNLLLNGSTGIAVGMATNIPPHNLREVADAIQLLIENPDAGPETIMSVIKGPDFPTGGIIMGHAGIRSAYYTGRGKITLRGRAEIQELGKDTRIVVTEIPYMVNKTRLLEGIGNLMRDKRIEGISAMRDESDRMGMKIVIELSRGANANVVLNKLYSFTQLQETVGVIMLALVDGVPRILTLKQMLEHYLAFQEDVITRRVTFDLEKARKRAHLLQGLVLAVDNVDEVISILRASKNIPEGKENLIERFKDVDMTEILSRSIPEFAESELAGGSGLSKEQADAIVALTWGQLTGLEREKLTKELISLIEKVGELSAILRDRNKILAIISEELKIITSKYGDERRTSIEAVSGEVDIEDLIPVEECVLTYTNKGYIKRQLSEVYNLQKRGGKGVSGMKQREEDFVENIFISSTHDNVLFVTNFGNMYKLKCYEIPEGSRQSRGTNIVNLLMLGEDERIAAMMKTSDFAENKYFVCVTRQGLIKRTPLSSYKNVRKNGLRAISLNDGDEIAAAHLTEGDSSVLIATAQGMAIHFDESLARKTGRTARGVRSIRLREGDYVVGAAKVYDDSCTILTVTERGMGRRAGLSSYRKQNRGGKGLMNYRINSERGLVCGIRSLYDDDDIILINDEGIIIRIRANDLRVMGRYAGGVRVMRLSENSRVVTFTRTEHDEGEDFEDVEDTPETADEAELAALEAEEAEEAEEVEEAEILEESEEAFEEASQDNYVE
ncbi:MAG: DNA gyrase subunit A [Oscillospiraceae bacterium]|nr:DNA gyrase subunit A [Oscillospiraceae bacterium]